MRRVCRTRDTPRYVTAISTTTATAPASHRRGAIARPEPFVAPCDPRGSFFGLPITPNAWRLLGTRRRSSIAPNRHARHPIVRLTDMHPACDEVRSPVAIEVADCECNEVRR